MNDEELLSIKKKSDDLIKLLNETIKLNLEPNTHPLVLLTAFSFICCKLTYEVLPADKAEDFMIAQFRNYKELRKKYSRKDSK